MKRHNARTIAAAMVATIVISLSMLPACKGRHMSDMEPTGDTIEVEIEFRDTDSPTDTIPLQP